MREKEHEIEMRNRFLKSPFSRFLPRHRHSDTVRHSNMRTLIALVVLTLVLALVQAAKVEVEVTSVRKRGSGIGATGGAGRVRARHTAGARRHASSGWGCRKRRVRGWFANRVYTHVGSHTNH